MENILLSAPCFSGFREEFATELEAQLKAAELLGVEDRTDLVEVECNGVHYIYASQADANADQDGAYAVKYGPAESL